MRACNVCRDKMGKALRQRSQKLRQRRQDGQPTTAPRVGAAIHPALTSPTTTTSSTDNPLAHSPITGTPEPTGVVDAQLRKAFLGVARESKESRAFQRAIQQADSKAAAADAFLLLARTGEEAISAATLKTFTATMLERHADSQMAPGAFAASLADVVGGVDDANARWADTSVEERRCFAAYQCRELARRAEKGTTFNREVGLTVEGSDNEIVSLTEYHLRKAVAQDKMLPPPTDVLTDLALLDVSWRVALRLLEYARELRGNAVPTVEMNDRVMGLVTGYKTNGLGSRPWTTALALYRHALDSGMDLTTTTHTHALDAVWRSADGFHKSHNGVTEAHRQWILDQALAVQAEMARSGLEARLAGEEGCAYMESLIKATSAAGRWDTAVRLLLEMETQPQTSSHRFLVPTAESFVFAIAACLAAGHASHAEALTKLFTTSGHTLRSLHSEVLLIYLQALRRHVKTNVHVGSVVESLLTDGHGLDRPCAVACLQLLSSAHTQTKQAKTQLAQVAFDLYDGNVWIQQPLARKVELQTVFRCCHLVDSRELFFQRRPDEGAACGAVIGHVRRRLQTVFGPGSPELEWLDDTEVYALMVTMNIDAALATYDRQVTQRPPAKIKFLPMPIREVKLLLAQALLRCCRAKKEASESSESFALEEEDFHESEQHGLRQLLARCVATCRTVFADDAGMPREVVAELLLMEAVSSTDYKQRKTLATEALQHLSLGSATTISAAVVHLVSEALSLTTMHVETTVVEEHAKLRAKTLAELDGEQGGTLDDIVQREYV